MEKITKTTFESIIAPEKGSLISGPFGSNISKKFFVSEGVPVIRGNNLSLGQEKFIDDGFVYVTKEKAQKLDCYAHCGDIIFTAAGTIGQVGVIPGDSKYKEYVISNKQIRATLDEKKVDILYIYYWLSSPWVRKYLIKNNKGSTVPLLSLNEIRNIPVYYPDIKTQQKISHTISLLDKKIANNNTISEQLESMAKTIYDYWFLQFEFPNEEGKPYKSSGGKMVWNEDLQREIPEGWGVENLGNVIIENRKSTIKVGDVSNVGKIPFFTSGASILKTENPLVSGMNCYLNTGGNADIKSYFGDASYSTDTWCITAKNGLEYFLPFLFDKLKPSMDTVFFQGTGLKHLQKNLLRSYRICIPSQTVLDKFTKVAKEVFIEKHSLLEETEELKKMKDFLLPVLMNGQVTIKE